MKHLLSDTRLRESRLRARGYNLKTIWECEFNREIKNNETLKNFIKNLPFMSPLKPRDAFFGGRCKATRLHYTIKNNEQIKYVDFCSLYPSVNKYGKYPINHPDVLTTNLSTNINNYEGFIKCKILPPQNLFHPVLPIRLHKKLIFPLCF